MSDTMPARHPRALPLLVGLALAVPAAATLGGALRPLQASDALADSRSEAEIRSRIADFNRAWEARDLAFVDGYFAHDDGLLLFFERRQLHGWPKVEQLYRTMFAHAAGSVDSRISNLQVRARGEMAVAAMNFELRVRTAAGEESRDEGRQSVVFERRDGRWLVVHRHTSFQAPPGPQRRVPLHTEPGPLWDPTLEGAWTSEGGALMVASARHLSFTNAAPLPAAARYRLAGDRLELEPLDGVARTLWPVRLSGATLSFRAGDKAWTWRRVD